MDIIENKITVRDLSDSYQDNLEDGVSAFGGKLDVRPPFQREFVYSDNQRDDVIRTVERNFPLNIMYWTARDDGTYEILDGQQRTISLCQYVHGVFSIDSKYFHNLQDDEQKKILDYELTIYQCRGDNSEKLEWFKTINIAGEELTRQELRNAVYHGPWLTDAKRYFSKTNCPAYAIGQDYLTGKPIRQEYLETVIKWISNNQIEEYMGKNQREPTSIEIWNYFQSVISWLESIFINKRKEMKGVAWGELYNEFSKKSLDPKEVEKEIKILLEDDDVTNHKGIYPYILSQNEKYLNIRKFDDKIKRRVYEKQKGICNISGKKLDISEMEADHITPWHEGGKTNEENCQMISKEENRKKSGK